MSRLNRNAPTPSGLKTPLPYFHLPRWRMPTSLRVTFRGRGIFVSAGRNHYA